MIPKDLIAAYKATNYRVLAEHEFSLRIDERCEDLYALFDQFETKTATFITAWNPYSEEKILQENAKQNELLKSDLVPLSAQILPAFGAWPNDPTKGEDSFLAIGISENDAVILGKKYKQNAILFVANDAIPRLVLFVE